MTILLSCEHASHFIPREYLPLFSTAEPVLQSHEGWDPGARTIAEVLKKQLQAPLFVTEVSRLLVEVNRSMGHSQLFSKFTAPLSAPDKETLLNRFYFPYRNAILNFIQKSPKPVLHVSIHTFTPIWNGKVRAVDIGILFDPSRKFEKQVGDRLHRDIQEQLPHRLICDNEPYQGIDDGLTTYLRTQFPDDHYAGIEMEINQKFSADTGLEISRVIGGAIKKIIGDPSR